MKRMSTQEKLNQRRRLTLLGVALFVMFFTGSIVLSVINGFQFSDGFPFGRNTSSSKTSDGIYLNSGQLLLYVPNQNTDNNPHSPISKSAQSSASYTVHNLLQTQNITTKPEDLTLYNNRSGPIYKKTFLKSNAENVINLSTYGQVRNETNLSNDETFLQSLIPPNIQIEKGSVEPQVLIYHTHTTESYEPFDSDYYDDSYPSRTLDSDKSVVAVGTKIAQSIAEAGIAVLHDGTLHDYPQYSGAYARSEETVKRILQEYPSIKVILDIHRDAIVEDDGSRVAAVTQINGKEAAQVMIISAADDGTYDMPDFIENYRFACLLQRQIEEDWNGLTRPVLFQYCQYNQHLSTGALLLEIGSHGNSIEQALYSGELVGQSIAKALLTLQE
jgi:stage II sporulation protein P